jgi:tRNA (guanine37-N1)-methyltransferase
MFEGPFDHSIIKNAKKNGLVEISYINIRDFGVGKHKMVDDTEYGGGVGMVMKVDVLHNAITHARCDHKSKCHEKVILLSATGKTYRQKIAREYSSLDHLIILCGHYEGVDERIKKYIDEELSIGDFILTGGEIPAMLVIDSVSRLVSGVLPIGAAEDESFSEIENQILLEYPHYTKPQTYSEEAVPEVLLSGNHSKIKDWRIQKSLEITKKLRPDLAKKR